MKQTRNLIHHQIQGIFICRIEYENERCALKSHAEVDIKPVMHVFDIRKDEALDYKSIPFVHMTTEYMRSTNGMLCGRTGKQVDDQCYGRYVTMPFLHVLYR